MDCQHNWSHIGIVCFPNIENKDFFRTNNIESDEEMLKVLYCTIWLFSKFYLQYVLTKKELEDSEFRWIEQLALPLKKQDTLKEG